MSRMPEGISFEHILVLATSVAYGHWASLVSDSGTYGALRSSAQCPGEPGPSPVRPRHRDPSGSLGVHSWCIQKIFHHFHMFEHNTPPGAKLGLCRRTIYSKLSTSDHNLFQIFLRESKLNSDLASSYFPL